MFWIISQLLLFDVYLYAVFNTLYKTKYKKKELKFDFILILYTFIK